MWVKKSGVKKKWGYEEVGLQKMEVTKMGVKKSGGIKEVQEKKSGGKKQRG